MFDHICTWIDNPKLILVKMFLISLRPKQWTKNLLLYMAFFFTVNEAWQLGEPGELISMGFAATSAMVIFAILSGTIYVFNDVLDKDEDSLHPQKSNRPIASGNLPIPIARNGALILVVIGVGSAFLLGVGFGLVVSSYLVIMLLYSLFLKKLMILDVVVIGVGFIMRVVAGAVAISVPISLWLYVCTGLGSLLIATSKRYSELRSAGKDASHQRSALNQYRQIPKLLPLLIVSLAVSSMGSYVVYCIFATNLPDNNSMAFTLPFVFIGLSRYIYLVMSKGLGEAPEDLLISDKPLMLAIGFWLLTTALVLLLYRS